MPPCDATITHIMDFHYGFACDIIFCCVGSNLCEDVFLLFSALQWREDGTQSQKIGPIMRKPEDAKLANLTIEELEIEFRISKRYHMVCDCELMTSWHLFWLANKL